MESLKKVKCLFDKHRKLIYIILIPLVASIIPIIIQSKVKAFSFFLFSLNFNQFKAFLVQKSKLAAHLFSWWCLCIGQQVIKYFKREKVNTLLSSNHYWIIRMSTYWSYLTIAYSIVSTGNLAQNIDSILYYNCNLLIHLYAIVWNHVFQDRIQRIFPSKKYTA